MRRLEIIRLRLTGPRRTDTLAAIRESLAGLGARGHVEVYRHAGIPTDIGIHLRHEGDRADPELTLLGARLADSLREMGMVEHAVWDELESGG